MSQALGDRAYDDVRRSIEAAIRSAAHRARGTVLKSTGDGGLVVFQSAADAIDAAIALQTEIDLLPARQPDRVRMRIGLAVGDVTVEPGDCHGTPVVEAARLETAAPPGGILCTALVKLLAGSRTGAIFLAHDPVSAKGFDTPLEAWQIPWASTSSSGGILTDTLHRRELLPFAGRHAEMATVMAAVLDASAGRGRGVLIGGEPGIGKSRLTREVARRAASDGAVVLHGRCDDGMGRPYQPFAEALAAFLRLVPGAIDQLGPGASDLRLVLPELIEAVPGLPEPLTADSDTLRYRLSEAVAGWLLTASTQRPVLLVIDDLHWADRGTGQIVQHVLASIDHRAVAVAITYRTTEAEGSADLVQLIAQLRRLGNVERVSLDGLDVDDIQSLASASGHAGDEHLARLVHERTGGNAFFAAEVLRNLDPDTDPSVGVDAIPSAVHDVVVARVMKMTPAARELLSGASVFGRMASYEQLGRVLDRSRRDVARAAAEVVGAGLLRELESPPMHVEFTHALVRSALYDQLIAAERSLLHEAAAGVLIELSGDRVDDVAEQLGSHLSRTGSVDDARAAIGWYRRAAVRDSRQAAEAQAASQLRRALAVLDQPGVPDDARIRCELLCELGDALRRGRLDGYRQTLLQAGDLARAHGFDDLLVGAASVNTRGFFSSAGASDADRIALLRDALAVETEATATRARLLSNLSVELTFGAGFAERLSLSDEAVAIARAHGSGDDLFHVLGMRYGTLWTAQGLAARTTLAAELRALADDLERDELRYIAAWCTFQAAMESGDLSLADAMLAEQESIAEVTPTQLSYLRIRQGLRAAVAGDLGQAERYVNDAFEAAAIAGEPDAYTFYFSQLAGLRYHQGRMDELTSTFAAAVEATPGLPALRAGLGLIHLEADRLDDVAAVVAELGAQRRDVGDELNWLITIALLAELAARVKDRERCAELYPVLLPFREQFVDNATNWFGSVGRFLGLLEHVVGRFDDADRSFAAALRAHEAIPAPLLAARTHLDWAVSMLDRPNPRHADAAGHLRVALDLGTQYGLAAVERRAATTLARIGESPVGARGR